MLNFTFCWFYLFVFIFSSLNPSKEMLWSPLLGISCFCFLRQFLEISPLSRVGSFSLDSSWSLLPCDTSVCFFLPAWPGSGSVSSRCRYAGGGGGARALELGVKSMWQPSVPCLSSGKILFRSRDISSGPALLEHGFLVGLGPLGKLVAVPGKDMQFQGFQPCWEIRVP